MSHQMNEKAKAGLNVRVPGMPLGQHPASGIAKAPVIFQLPFGHKIHAATISRLTQSLISRTTIPEGRTFMGRAGLTPVTPTVTIMPCRVEPICQGRSDSVPAGRSRAAPLNAQHE